MLGETIIGVIIEETRKGFILNTVYRPDYDPTIDVPEGMQLRERQRRTTATDLIELTKMGYFNPTKETGNNG